MTFPWKSIENTVYISSPKTTSLHPVTTTTREDHCDFCLKSKLTGVCRQQVQTRQLHMATHRGVTQVKGMFDVVLQRTVCPGRGLRYVRKGETHTDLICFITYVS